MEDENFNLRSEQVQEILGHIPHWLIRSGNTAILFIVLGILVLSYFIKYPESISSSVMISTSNPMEKIFAKMSGELHEIKIQDGDYVYLEDSLAVLRGEEQELDLYASLAGRVHFSKLWKERSHVQQGDLIFIIVPPDHGAWIGEILVPLHEAGKISKGQVVRIRISNELEGEYDALEGQVQRIASVPDGNGYIMVEATLDKKLATVRGEALEYMPGLTGSAEIFVKDHRLIERFFGAYSEILNP